MNHQIDIEELVLLRHTLHQNAELSNQEEKTAQIVKSYLEKFKPDKVYENIGGHGLIVEFKGSSHKKLNIGFRADLDALPIDETIELEYGSKTADVAHKCGHDGHSTMVAAIAQFIIQLKNRKNSIFLIFQPAEEIGEGAEAISSFLEEKNIQLDYLFGLHNLPGFEKGSIVSRKGTFAAASTGMVIKLKGQTSHAAEPENGVSPAIAFSNIIQGLTNLTEKSKFHHLVLSTVIHAKMGEIAFGTSPGYAEIRATLRAYKDDELDKLIALAEELVIKESKEHGLTYKLEYTESFPTTENSEDILKLLKDTAEEQSLNFKEKEEPFKWSEDFGHYKRITKSGFFGLGAGPDCPMLHNDTYDFPDEIIADGIRMYTGLIQFFEANG
jgi:amidohydrolase